MHDPSGMSMLEGVTDLDGPMSGFFHGHGSHPSNHRQVRSVDQFHDDEA